MAVGTDSLTMQHPLPANFALKFSCAQRISVGIIRLQTTNDVIGIYIEFDDVEARSSGSISKLSVVVKVFLP
jgi:hypothetical protein